MTLTVADADRRLTLSTGCPSPGCVARLVIDLPEDLLRGDNSKGGDVRKFASQPLPR